MRYPGGWESEYYDWDKNTTPIWKKTPPVSGDSVALLKANVSHYNIVVPNAAAMNKALWSTDWWNALANLKNTAINKVDPTNVKIIEIGNE